MIDFRLQYRVIRVSGFLELINNMLTLGMVAALFDDEEKDGIIGALRNAAKQKGYPVTKWVKFVFASPVIAFPARQVLAKYNRYVVNYDRKHSIIETIGNGYDHLYITAGMAYGTISWPPVSTTSTSLPVCLLQVQPSEHDVVTFRAWSIIRKCFLLPTDEKLVSSTKKKKNLLALQFLFIYFKIERADLLLHKNTLLPI